MVFSRIRRYEERRQRRRLYIAVFGILGILIFLYLFGLKILVGFSVFVDALRGQSSTSYVAQSIILPPTLNPLPEATNSATIDVSGSGQPGSTVVVYINEKEVKKLTIAGDGAFIASGLRISEGENIVSAKALDEKGNISDLSNIVQTTVKKAPPLVEVNQPSDGEVIAGETNAVVVVGRAEEGVAITINGRFVVVGSDGSFRHTVTLSEGDNTITVVAVDEASNTTRVKRRVTYQK